VAKKGPVDAAVVDAATTSGITPRPLVTPWTVDPITEAETTAIVAISANARRVGGRPLDTTREEIGTVSVPTLGAVAARTHGVGVRAILALDRLLPAATGGGIRLRDPRAGATHRRGAGVSIRGVTKTGVVTGLGAIRGVQNPSGANLEAAVQSPNLKNRLKKKSSNPSSMSRPKTFGPSLFPPLL
jgi:hypothetical protein